MTRTGTLSLEKGEERGSMKTVVLGAENGRGPSPPVVVETGERTGSGQKDTIVRKEKCKEESP